MTANEVITLANTGYIARGELDLHSILRLKIVPELLEAGRDSLWRQMSFTLSLDTTARKYATDPRAEGIRAVKLVGDTYPLPNVTEDPDRFALAVNGEDVAKPSEYIVTQEDGGIFITFTSTPDTTYTARVVALRGLAWVDPGPSDINFDQLIPKSLQYGLVEGLKSEIYRDRYGINDQSYLDAKTEFERYKAMASFVSDHGPSGHIVKSVF